jgi:hypothetical protein
MKSSQQIESSAKKKFIDTVGTGAVLWAIGYALGMVLFAFVHVAIIGWIIIPIMVPITAYASFWRLKTAKSISYILVVATAWTVVAVAFDYAFLVSAFNVQNYYDFDVMIYYALTFLLPALIGVKYRKV